MGIAGRADWHSGGRFHSEVRVTSTVVACCRRSQDMDTPLPRGRRKKMMMMMLISRLGFKYGSCSWLLLLLNWMLHCCAARPSPNILLDCTGHTTRISSPTYAKQLPTTMVFAKWLQTWKNDKCKGKTCAQHRLPCENRKKLKAIALLFCNNRTKTSDATIAQQRVRNYLRNFFWEYLLFLCVCLV